MGRSEVPFLSLLDYQNPNAVARYYQQRYNIFSKYDAGIWMTDEAWFGVTPEPIARLVHNYEKERHKHLIG